MVGKAALALVICILSSTAASARCLDPDDSIPANARLIAAGEPCLKSVPDKPRPKLIEPPRQVDMPFRPLTEIEKQIISIAVTSGFYDPDSALFRWSPMRGTVGRYCGFVNGKNRYGGYVGYKLFAVELTQTRPIPTASDAQVIDIETGGWKAEMELIACKSVMP